VGDWPLLLSLAVLLIGLAIYGYRARRHNAVNRWFALQTLTLALWVIGIAGTHTGHYPEFWGRWTFSSACLMPATFFGFTCVFPDGSRPRSARALSSVVTIALVFVALSAFTPLIAHTFIITPNGLRRLAGPLMPLFSLYFLMSTVLVLALLIAKWRKATGQAKAQLRFYNTGLLTLCAGAITTNLLLPALSGHSGYSTVGPYFVLPLVGLIGHAIIRHRLLDLRLMIHRGAAFLIFITLASFAIIVLLNQINVAPELDAVSIPIEGLIVLVVAAASLSLPLAPQLSRLMDNYLLRSRPDLDRALQETARRLARLLTVPDIAHELETALRTTLAINDVKVLTTRTEAADLSPDLATAAWAIPLAPPAVRLLFHDADGPLSSPDVRILKDKGFEVWAGLGRGGEKTGIILLGPRNGGEAYLASTLQFIEDIAELSSMAFEVALLHRRQIDLERERNRLEHFARMGRAYAGLGHEIRTPLTTISNLVALIPDRLDDAEFRGILTRLIPGEVARIVKLTEQLRLMAPGDSARFGPVDLRRILNDISAIKTAAGEDLEIKLEGPADLPMVRGDESQLIQLFLNLVTNAVEAMPQGGTVTARLSTTRSNGGRSMVRADILDEGPGISREVSERIFEPFFTTKASGTGLGLSICREIGDLHGATLTVSARPGGVGTVATVEFAALPSKPHIAPVDQRPAADDALNRVKSSKVTSG
jgi:signal transduction histidine kinase